MTAEPVARSPLAHRSQHLRAIGTVDRSLWVAEVPFLTQVGLRAEGVPTSGLALPLEPDTVRIDGERATLWLGPDEWLVTGPPGSAGAVIADLHAGLGDRPHACMDLSANRAVLDLGGSVAFEVLDRGCSLDLHPSRWSEGMCAQTNLARAQVILQQGPEVTRIFVRPSFASYLVDWLASAAAAVGG